MKADRTLRILEENVRESASLIGGLTAMATDVARAAALLKRALKNGKKIIVFGDGGSAADSQHFTAELVCRFERNRRPVRAVSLTVNTSNITAIANDFGWEYSFSRQLEALGRRGDAALAISTSGNSQNVLSAVRVARKLGIKAAALSGCGGGKLKKLADVSLIVPSRRTARIQEAHSLILHTICQSIESDL